MKLSGTILIIGMTFTGASLQAQIDTDASDKTKVLYENLKMIQNGFQFLFGQEFFNSFQFSSGSAHGNKTFSDSYDITGAHPAVLGSDFHYYLEKDVTERGYHTEAVKWAYEQGLAITFDWHLSGKGTSTYEYGESTKDLVDSIVTYPNGQDRAWLYEQLDKVIDIVNNDLVVNNERIPIVFRPWHEMNGNWFWWGSSATTPAHYKTFYALTVDYVKARTNSVLFCWSPNTPTDFDYYPGDNYVDVLGLDYYEINATALQQELAPIVDHAQANNKVAVFSESGNRTTNGEAAASYWKNTVLPAIVNNQGVKTKIAWVLTWINASWSFPYVPYSNSSPAAKQSFMSFKNSQYVLFSDKIQNLYTPWIINAVPPDPGLPAEEIELFPVPAENRLTLRVKSGNRPVKIDFIDVTGKTVYQMDLHDDETNLELSNILAPGLYLVRTTGDTRKISKKILVNFR